jgi:amidophosphoribosyltransferase
MLVTDDVIAFASERVPLMTVFEAEADQVKAVDPGSIITIKSDGSISDTAMMPPQRFTPCSFEKIYFSRGNDPLIYRERKSMGAALVPQIIDGSKELNTFVLPCDPFKVLAPTGQQGMVSGYKGEILTG